MTKTTDQALRQLIITPTARFENAPKLMNSKKSETIKKQIYRSTNVHVIIVQFEIEREKLIPERVIIGDGLLTAQSY